MLGGLPPAGNFLRAGIALLGFFLTFVGVGALIKVLRNDRG